MSPFTAAGSLLLVAFFGLEILLRGGGEARSVDAGSQDRGSTLAIGLAFGLSVAAGLLVHLLAVPAGIRAAGLALMLCGLPLRVWAMRTLGRFYSRALRTQAGQRVVSEGPYRIVRHPGYAASLLVWMGFGLALGSLAATLLIAACVGAAYAWRIRTEEALLRRQLGAEYERYARRTARLLPGLF